MLDRSMVKSRQLGAGQLNQLDPLGRLERPGPDSVIDFERDCVSSFRIELGMHNRPVEVSLAVTNLVGVEVEPDHRLDGILARLDCCERTWKAIRAGADSQRLTRPPIV